MLGEDEMKNILFTRLSVRTFLIICLCSSSAYVLIPVIKNIWREITEVQAQKISLKIPSWAPLVERAQPAVVVITTEATVERPALEFPGMPFYMPMPPEMQT